MNKTKMQLMNLMTVETLISHLQRMPKDSKVCVAASFKQAVIGFHISLKDSETEIIHNTELGCVTIRLLGNAQNEC